MKGDILKQPIKGFCWYDTPKQNTTWKDMYFKIKNKLKNCWCQKLQFCLGIILPCERCARLDRARAFIKNCLIEVWDKILFIKYVTPINIIYCECKICIALIEVLWVYWSWTKTDNTKQVIGISLLFHSWPWLLFCIAYIEGRDINFCTSCRFWMTKRFNFILSWYLINIIYGGYISIT